MGLGYNKLMLPEEYQYAVPENKLDSRQYSKCEIIIAKDYYPSTYLPKSIHTRTSKDRPFQHPIVILIKPRAYK